MSLLLGLNFSRKLNDTTEENVLNYACESQKGKYRAHMKNSTNFTKEKTQQQLNTSSTMDGPLRVGVMSAAFIAKKTIKAVSKAEGAEVVAVASRSLEKAKAFAESEGALLACIVCHLPAFVCYLPSLPAVVALQSITHSFTHSFTRKHSHSHAQTLTPSHTWQALRSTLAATTTCCRMRAFRPCTSHCQLAFGQSG